MKPITLREHEVRHLKATGEALVVREVKPQPEQREGGITPILFDVSGWEFMDIEGGGQPVKCPLGKPGDRLWVREEFGIGGALAIDPCVNYRADGAQKPLEPIRSTRDALFRATRGFGGGPLWLPACRMPHAASRSTVEIVAVKVKRVKEVTEEEAHKTGCRPEFDLNFKTFIQDRFSAKSCTHVLGVKRQYAKLWSSNPWCWFALVKEVK